VVANNGRGRRIGVIRPGNFEEMERVKVVEVDSRGGGVVLTTPVVGSGGRRPSVS
jgi:hypothetical protein